MALAGRAWYLTSNLFGFLINASFAASSVRARALWLRGFADQALKTRANGHREAATAVTRFRFAFYRWFMPRCCYYGPGELPAASGPHRAVIVHA